MELFLYVIMLIFLFWVITLPKKKQCNKCGGRNTSPMGYETGQYCNDCYEMFE